MFKLYLKYRNDMEEDKIIDLLEESAMAFFRHLNSRVIRLELYENTGSIDEPVWRLIVHATSSNTPETFRITRILNIF